MVIVGAWTASVWASGVVVAPADVQVADGAFTYTYELTYADMHTADHFNRDRHAHRWGRLVGAAEGDPRFFALWGGTGGTNAYVVYRFDFAESGYRPVKMTVRDSLAGGAVDRVEAVTSYSADEQAWTPIRSVMLGHAWVFDVDTKVVALADGPDTVFYRVEFNALPDDPDGQFTGDVATQWNRVPFRNRNADDMHFKIVFDLQPE